MFAVIVFILTCTTVVASNIAFLASKFASFPVCSLPCSLGNLLKTLIQSYHLACFSRLISNHVSSRCRPDPLPAVRPSHAACSSLPKSLVLSAFLTHPYLEFPPPKFYHSSEISSRATSSGRLYLTFHGRSNLPLISYRRL